MFFAIFVIVKKCETRSELSISNLEKLASSVFPLDVTVSLDSLEGVVEQRYQHVQHEYHC